MLLFTSLIVLFGVVRTDEPLRPQYHLMPVKNWLNDPNGPVYFNGYYHMFFQYNPNAAVWGDMHWAHSYSKDMVHWIHLPIALAPDQPYDTNGIFTGSITIVDGIPIIIYTGITHDNQQVQCQAQPANISDPTLTTWIKSPLNPLITYPNGRDPSTAFQDNEKNYYLIYGYGTDELGGQAVLFISKDFSNWTYLHPIHSNRYDKFWECPDIFNITNRVVLKASLLGRDFWTIGDIDPNQLIFIPIDHDLGEFVQLIDHGKFYASKTFYDPMNDQQIIMGWTSEDDNLGPQRGWQGFHTLPRAIFLSEDGLELRSRPIEALRTLRDSQSHRHFNDIILPRELPFQLIPNVNGNQIEIEINWQFPMNQNLDFGLIVLSTPDGTQRTNVGITSRNNTTVMMNWDLPGWDYLSVPNISESSGCQLSCNRDNRCQAWTFVKDQQINKNCFLKSGVPFLISNLDCVSGVKQRENNEQIIWVYMNRTLSQKNPNAAHGPIHAPVWLEATSTNNQWFLQLDIFVDHSVIEIFEPQQGRFAITGRVYPEEDNANNLAVYVNNASSNNENIIVNTIDIWNLNTIWA
ncbi:unnamed protein product [Rotaria magnacalcarata]|uniref:Apple domain-containing protein n=5 Tax=Rotaria magnacalcarata TaxID=392030 RepID=A0A820B734_9BILA|nr:unnamed protein product [Rotaria magnacalcarata]CAF1508326.1 unnamed protein product [Rotaria magnacalcarata]CAF1933866.1 unnamed protein product [Rotaria magnacalcarata]CAF2043209.1 unnamed protein product [Rotaria magnacalcarata]CAF2102846.1 unnamed protein product [Rotaria magnacalcarata]